MKPNSALNGRRGAAIGAVIGIVVVVAVAAFVGVWVKQDRDRSQGQIETLRSDLATAHARSAELEEQLMVVSEARDQAEQEAKETETAAAATREELQQLTGQIQQLEADTRKFQQRIAAAEEEALKMASELSREKERREAAELEVADVNDQLQEQVTLVSQLQGGAGQVSTAEDFGDDTNTRSPADAEARPGATAAAKQRLADDDLSGTKAAFDTAPKPLELTSPEYPRGLKRNGTEGYVVVAFTVNAQGRVEAVEVQESTHDEFANAAAAAVRQWRFKPALRDGEPVEVRISQKLEFTSN